MRVRCLLFVVTSVLGAISTAGCWDGQPADFSRWQDSGVVADGGVSDGADASMDSRTGESTGPDGNGGEDGGDESDGGTRDDGTASGVCGNGEVESDEQCDDENETSGDGCSEACQIEEGFRCPVAGSRCEECGNGEVESTEVCDDGNRRSGDGCNESCTFMEATYACPVEGEPCEKCGDGTEDAHERCDDGNAASGDGCNASCTAIELGFSCAEAGESCEPICGDAVLAGSETCDDRNTDSGDGCDGSCHVEPGWQCPVVGVPCVAANCGDGIIAGNEECEDDDDPPASGDGCDANCRLEASPDFAHGYACDVPGEPCVPTDCGDAKPEGSEQCDDGNNDTGDGCSPWCTLEPLCENATCTSSDGCVSACGDGLKLAPEQCDDGNTRGGDGCSATCQVETGFGCSDITEEEPDELVIPIILRDFEDTHADFESDCCGTETGTVETCLGSDGKPVYAMGDGSSSAMTHGQAAFDQWYRDVDGVNMAMLDTVALVRQPAGEYVFERTGSNQFFPLDDRGFGNDGRSHNYHFTSELRYWFEYRGGEYLNFSGDDDVFVFVNGHLAIDIGGVHTEEWDEITLDNTVASDYGLQVGNVYEIVVFQAERHTTESNYTLTVSDFRRTVSECESICGDGIVTRFELCDDGEHNGEYGKCGEDCTPGPHCGDGIVQQDEGEACDDGVVNGGYGGYGQCAPGCVPGPHCGDGHKDVGYEQCDDGNTEDGDGCTSNCELEWCGNGVLDPGEACDDGNTEAGDGCSPRCDEEVCGNGWVDPGEECDDGVNDGGYGECDEGCVWGPRCGDGELQRDEGEQCDDGNTQDGDACSAECQRESIG